MTDLDKAREWSDRIRNASDNGHPIDADCYSAAEAIQSLPDQWVDVEKVREVISSQLSNYTRDTVGHYIAEEIASQLESLLAPKLPTLADMTQEEREACQWMQCEVETDDGYSIGVIRRIWSTKRADILYQTGRSLDAEYRRITPVPGPKLQWPGSDPESTNFDNLPDEAKQVMKESIEDFKAGRFVDFDSSPRPGDVPDPHPGEAWLVNTREGEQREALKAGNRWYVKDGDDVEEWVEEALTPISRLVPESHTLPEGMRLADHETLGRIVVSQRADEDGDYAFFESIPGGIAGASWGYVNESELTFLDGDQHV